MGGHKLKSMEELQRIREEALKNTQLRMTSENPERAVLAVGMATCGIAAGARVTMQALRDEIDRQGLKDVSVIVTGCFGYCYAEPMVEVRMAGRDPVRYGHVDDARAREIIDKHVMHGMLLDDAIIAQEVPQA